MAGASPIAAIDHQDHSTTQNRFSKSQGGEIAGGVGVPVVHPPRAPGPDWGGARERCVREARRVLRDGHAAEEAAQEAVLRAWRYRGTCRSRDSWTPWLVKIARREAFRVAERTQRVLSAEVSQVSEVADDRDTGDLSEVVDSLVFRQRLASLPEEDQALIRLRYEDELTNPEIARALSLPVGTVKVRLHRLRHRLREAITDEGEQSSR
jgi:RNA polymerase sigma-70 factor (ECF subfamily)